MQAIVSNSNNQKEIDMSPMVHGRKGKRGGKKKKAPSLEEFHCQMYEKSNHIRT